jgi:TonB family protein
VASALKRRIAAAGLAVAVASFVWGAPRVAFAQELVAPHAIEAGVVPYPAGAHGDAVVVVELLVDTAGRVAEVKILEGADPFATSTFEAAATWRFTPARRGDNDVAARIRMRVDFHPAAAVPEPEEVAPIKTAPAADPAKAREAARAAREAEAEEVRVRGARHEAGQMTMAGGEVRQMPGAFGDAFRAMESMPGVVPIVSGLPYFFVRGAPPGNTGYFLDGVRVPLLYHLAFGPSIVHPGMVDHVDFFAGGFPARYGRFSGGILAGATRGPAKALHGEGNIRLFDAGALVETPFADGRGTVLAAGRYSYPLLITSLVAPSVVLSYWDYQARASWDLSKTDQVSVFFFGSYDYLGQKKKRGSPEEHTEQLFATQFHRADLRFDRAISSTGAMRLALTLGTDSSGNEDGDARNNMVGLRLEVEEKLAKDLRARAGADVVFDNYDVIDLKQREGELPPGKQPGSNVIAPRNEVVFGVRGDVIWRVTDRVEMIPGLRADIFTSRRIDYPAPRMGGTFDALTPVPPNGAAAAVGIDPRLATRVLVAKNVTWISTFGVSHQPPSFIVPVPGVNVGGLHQGLQTALQMSQGAEVLLPAEFTLTTTAFLHDYLGLTDITASGGVGGGDFGEANDDCTTKRVRGRAYGLELLLRRALTKRTTGWISYTLSRSTREAHPLFNRDALQNIPAEFDRTHVLSVIGAQDLGRGWRAGARFFFYTGHPYSRSFNRTPVPPYNSERLPPFYRVDVRLEKAWRVGKNGRFAFVLEGLNVTLHKEVIGVNCSPENAGAPIASNSVGTIGPLPPGVKLDTCTYEEIGPVTIPSIGVEGSF